MKALLVVWSLLLLAPAAGAVASGGESARLRRLFDAAWQDKLRQTPEFATYIGFPGYNDRWSDLSLAGLERRHALPAEQLKALLAIDRGRLTAVEQLYFDLFRRRLEGQIEGYRFPEELLRVTQYEGLQLDAPRALGSAPAATPRDYEDLLARLNALPQLVDQNIALLSRGLAAGITPPRILVAGVPAQVHALLPEDPWRSPLLVRFRQISSGVEEGDEARLRQAALYAYTKKAAPAFGRLLRFLMETYIPGCRESLGLGALPGGAEWYAYIVRKATTTDLTPRQVHEVGLAEVKRIRAEMEKTVAASGFAGSLADFVRFLHTDRRFFYDQSEELVEGYRAIAGRAEAKLPLLFGNLPRLPYRVIAIPAELAPTRAMAYYEPGSLKAGRPGSCFINTYDLKARPKWEMEVLALHECTPGHHLQVALAQQIEGAPKVLNYHDYTAFVEGWGVYAEGLGDEMGFYQDPYRRFGRLAYEMWRALRLVVDTGIHSQGWTKQQAIDFFRANTAQDERAIETEVNRYISEPGLALAYKIGELKLQELRATAQRELGPAFDLRAFHDQILRQGAMPLDLLERDVKAWVVAAKAARR